MLSNLPPSAVVTDMFMQQLCHPRTLKRGETVYKQRLVNLRHYRSDLRELEAECRGSDKFMLYTVRMKWNSQSKEFDSFTCTCPNGDARREPCKHVCATLFEVKDLLQRQKSVSINSRMDAILGKSKAQAAAPRSPSKVPIYRPGLHHSVSDHRKGGNSNNQNDVRRGASSSSSSSRGNQTGRSTSAPRDASSSSSSASSLQYASSASASASAGAPNSADMADVSFPDEVKCHDEPLDKHGGYNREPWKRNGKVKAKTVEKDVEEDLAAIICQREKSHKKKNKSKSSSDASSDVSRIERKDMLEVEVGASGNAQVSIALSLSSSQESDDINGGGVKNGVEDSVRHRSKDLRVMPQKKERTILPIKPDIAKLLVSEGKRKLPAMFLVGVPGFEADQKKGKRGKAASKKKQKVVSDKEEEAALGSDAEVDEKNPKKDAKERKPRKPAAKAKKPKKGAVKKRIVRAPRKAIRKGDVELVDEDSDSFLIDSDSDADHGAAPKDYPLPVVEKRPKRKAPKRAVREARKKAKSVEESSDDVIDLLGDDDSMGEERGERKDDSSKEKEVEVVGVYEGLPPLESGSEKGSLPLDEEVAAEEHPDNENRKKEADDAELSDETDVSADEYEAILSSPLPSQESIVASRPKGSLTRLLSMLKKPVAPNRRGENAPSSSSSSSAKKAPRPAASRASPVPAAAAVSSLSSGSNASPQNKGGSNPAVAQPSPAFSKASSVTLCSTPFESRIGLPSVSLELSDVDGINSSSDSDDGGGLFNQLFQTKPKPVPALEDGGAKDDQGMEGPLGKEEANDNDDEASRGNERGLGGEKGEKEENADDRKGVEVEDSDDEGEKAAPVWRTRVKVDQTPIVRGRRMKKMSSPLKKPPREKVGASSSSSRGGVALKPSSAAPQRRSSRRSKRPAAALEKSFDSDASTTEEEDVEALLESDSDEGSRSRRPRTVSLSPLSGEVSDEGVDDRKASRGRSRGRVHRKTSSRLL